MVDITPGFYSFEHIKETCEDILQSPVVFQKIKVYNGRAISELWLDQKDCQLLQPISCFYETVRYGVPFNVLWISYKPFHERKRALLNSCIITINDYLFTLDERVRLDWKIGPKLAETMTEAIRAMSDETLIQACSDLIKNLGK